MNEGVKTFQRQYHTTTRYWYRQTGWGIESTYEWGKTVRHDDNKDGDHLVARDQQKGLAN